MNNQNWLAAEGGFAHHISGKLLVHCFIMMFLGFFGGFAWLIALADNVFHILPMPRMEIPVPDQKELLRNTHTGPIMNAVYVMVVVLLSPVLKFTARQAKWVYYTAIVTLWGNALGYSAAVYAPERGLQPIGDWPNLVSYASFYVAVVGVTTFTAICLVSALRVAKAAPAGDS